METKNPVADRQKSTVFRREYETVFAARERRTERGEEAQISPERKE